MVGKVQYYVDETNVVNYSYDSFKINWGKLDMQYGNIQEIL